MTHTCGECEFAGESATDGSVHCPTLRQFGRSTTRVRSDHPECAPMAEVRRLRPWIDEIASRHQDALAERDQAIRELGDEARKRGVAESERDDLARKVKQLESDYEEAVRDILGFATPTTSDHEWAARWLFEHKGEKCACGYCQFSSGKGES